LVSSVAYLVSLAIVVFWPEHVDTWAGGMYAWLLHVVPALFPWGIDVPLNGILFVPFGGILGALLPRRPLSVLGLAWVISLLVEIAQGLFLPGRTSSAIDVAANTAGSVIGYMMVTIGRRLSERRRLGADSQERVRGARRERSSGVPREADGASTARGTRR